MKKIGFLLFGIVLAIVILSLQNAEGVSSAMKRTFLEVARVIEGGMIGAYHVIRSFVTEPKGV